MRSPGPATPASSARRADSRSTPSAPKALPASRPVIFIARTVDVTADHRPAHQDRGRTAYPGGERPPPGGYEALALRLLCHVTQQT